MLERIRRHPFAEIRGGRTIDPQTGQEGIADLGDDAWRVRQLAIRDLVRLGDAAAAELPAHLRNEDSHVRHVAAAVLGILKAEAAVKRSRLGWRRIRTRSFGPRRRCRWDRWAWHTSASC